MRSGSSRGHWAFSIDMIKLWALTAGVVACVAGIAALRARWKRANSDYSTEPVSTEWLAQARGREEHGW